MKPKFTIKPLVWEKYSNRHVTGYSAESMIGQFRVITSAINPGNIYVWAHNMDEHQCDSLEAGKAACEAQWQETIMQCLEVAE